MARPLSSLPQCSAMRRSWRLRAGKFRIERERKYPRGVKQSSKSPGKTPFSQNSGAKSGAVSEKNELDAGLRQVIVKWRTLPQALRKEIVAIVNLQSKLEVGGEAIRILSRRRLAGHSRAHSRVADSPHGTTLTRSWRSSCAALPSNSLAPIPSPVGASRGRLQAPTFAVPGRSHSPAGNRQ